MSIPDAVILYCGTDVPPEFEVLPRCLALLPTGLSSDDLGDDVSQQTGGLVVDSALRDQASFPRLSEKPNGTLDQNADRARGRLAT